MNNYCFIICFCHYVGFFFFLLCVYATGTYYHNNLVKLYEYIIFVCVQEKETEKVREEDLQV